jgi:vacuolar-type H+-ATPase subunit H
MNILDQIKECEQQAADIRAQAAAQSRDIVREGEQKAEQKAAEIVERAKETAREILSAAAVRSQQQAAAYIEAQAENDEKQTIQIAQRTGLAVDAIVKGVMRT